MPAALNITITDIRGLRRSFETRRANLDCGGGSREIEAGSPSFCRTFDTAALMITKAGRETVLVMSNGIASLTVAALTILCETVLEDTALKDRGPSSSFPVTSPEIRNNNSIEIHYIP